MLHHALASGAAVVTLARFELERCSGRWRSTASTQALVAPPLLPAFTHAASVDLPALRMLGAGGAPVTAALEEAAVDRLGIFVGRATA